MLRVRVLGELAIELDGRPVEPPASRRARALLGWLALDRRMQGRSGLAARFWPDVLDESARTSLRSALSALRRSLGPDSERYLIAGRDEVGLADESLVWTDVAEFERCLDEERLDDALALCRGELLAGLDDEWVYERRDEHRDRIAGVLARLATGAEGRGDLHGAIEHTRRQAALDPLAEEPHRELMRRLAAAGDRAGAIRTYERLSRRLRDQLRIAPSPATRELAEELRHGGELARFETAMKVMAPVAEPASAVVTLLFTDLVGSTALLGELGDDEAERLRRVHFALLRDVATVHSGQEVKNLGDGLMVAFGSVVGALNCAIGIQQAVHRHNARLGNDRLRVRVGLNVGEPIRDEGDYFGTPVVVAKRLCDSAEGGQILASELVRALVGSRGGFHFRACGPIGLKGISEPLPVVEILWEPAGERRVPLPAPLLGNEDVPLIGRVAQLDYLRRCWQEVQTGRRTVAMLVGEPGIGKTRLASEFCRGAHEDGALVLLGRCYEESLVPYQSLVEALRHYASETPPEELRPQMGRHREMLAKLLPELADATLEPFASPPAGAPEHEQFVLFDAVGSLLCAIANAQPVILLLDDLHWADAPTLSLLRHVARATERAPLMILGTYRGTEVDRAHPLEQALAELRRARALQHVALDGLDQEDVAALISSRVGRTTPAAVARSIVGRTQGNPFFVEELLRSVAGEEDVTGALAEIGIPQSVKDVLMRRLGRLDQRCTHLLTFAAISGREFTLDVLAQVTEMTADQVAETLEQAISARIVDEATGSVGRYSFAHALIREAIYEQLSRTRRAQLHRLVGEAIERVGGENADALASVLAYHFSAAGDAAKAYRYNSRAAAAAQSVYAVEPALSHYGAAFEAAAELGLDRDREPALRDLLLQRGKLRWRTGDTPGGAADFDQALDSSRRAGDRVIEMETLNEQGILALQSDLGVAAESHQAALEIARELKDTASETNALDRLAVISSHLLAFDRALELGEQALELARQTGEESLVGRAIDSIKLAVWQLGDLSRLEQLTGELERLWRKRDDLWYLQFTLLESAFVPIGQARWDEAAKRLAEAAAINRRVHDPLAEILILDALCWLQRSHGAYDESLSAGRRAVAIAPNVGWEAWVSATLGCALLELGAPGPAAEVLERGVAAGERIGAPNEIVRCLGQLAWAHWQLGALEKASALARRAEEILGRVSAPAGGAFVFGAHAYTAVARVLLATGGPERGEALLVPVLSAAQRTGWHEAVASAELVLGLCMDARGETDRAVAALAHAAELATEHGIAAPGWEAHRALARMTDESDEHLAAAAAIVERVSSGLSDDRLRAGLREWATP